MDRALVVYDMRGVVLSIIYGASQEDVPQGVPSVWCDIPAGAVIDSVDPQTGTVNFRYLPDTDIGKLQEQIRYATEFAAGMEGLINQALEESVQAATDASDAKSSAQLAAENASNANTLAEGNSSDITTIQNALAEVYELLISMEV